MTLLKNFSLKPGDVIDVIATTPGIEIADLVKQIDKLQRVFDFLELRANFNIEALLAGAKFFCDDATKVRQNELIKALSNDNKAIWFFKGGYGSAKLLAELKNYQQYFKPKILIGYSDLSSIHSWVNKFMHWPSIHASTLNEYLNKDGGDELQILKNLLFNSKETLVYDSLVPLNEAAKQESLEINGKITGGTLQVLQSGIGLEWQIDAADKILFLEEVYDRGVRIERTLTQFSQLGIFNQTKAIIFGDIICGDDPQGGQSCNLAINYFAANIKIPVFTIENFGHGKQNFPLPLNSECLITTKANNFALKFMG